MSCYGCTKRSRGCHDTCEDYQARKKKERDEKRKKIQYFRELNMVPKHREVHYRIR